MVKEKTQGKASVKKALAVQHSEKVGKLSEEELEQISGGGRNGYILACFAGGFLGNALDYDEPNFLAAARSLITRGNLLEGMLEELPEEMKVLPGGHKITKLELRAMYLGLMAGYVPGKVKCGVKKLVSARGV